MKNPRAAYELVYVADLRVGMELGANRPICTTLRLNDIVVHPAFDDVVSFLRMFWERGMQGLGVYQDAVKGAGLRITNET